MFEAKNSSLLSFMCLFHHLDELRAREKIGMQKPDIDLPFVTSKWRLDPDVVAWRHAFSGKLKAVVVKMKLKTVPPNGSMQGFKCRVLRMGRIDHIDINVSI